MARRKQAWSGWGGSPMHRVAGWDFDHRLNGYITTAADTFSCDCGQEFHTPSGYRKCGSCGRAWNSYVIGTDSHGKEAALEKVIVREIPVRKDVIVASKRTAKGKYNAFEEWKAWPGSANDVHGQALRDFADHGEYLKDPKGWWQSHSPEAGWGANTLHTDFPFIDKVNGKDTYNPNWLSEKKWTPYGGGQFVKREASRRPAGRHDAPKGQRYYDPTQHPDSYGEARTDGKGVRQPELDSGLPKHRTPWNPDDPDDPFDPRLLGASRRTALGQNTDSWFGGGYDPGPAEPGRARKEWQKRNQQDYYDENGRVRNPEASTPKESRRRRQAARRYVAWCRQVGRMPNTAGLRRFRTAERLVRLSDRHELRRRDLRELEQEYKESPEEDISIEHFAARRVGADGMSYEDTMAHIDKTLAEGERTRGEMECVGCGGVKMAPSEDWAMSRGHTIEGYPMPFEQRRQFYWDRGDSHPEEYGDVPSHWGPFGNWTESSGFCENCHPNSPQAKWKQARRTASRRRTAGEWNKNPDKGFDKSWPQDDGGWDIPKKKKRNKDFDGPDDPMLGFNSLGIDGPRPKGPSPRYYAELFDITKEGETAKGKGRSNTPTMRKNPKKWTEHKQNGQFTKRWN